MKDGQEAITADWLREKSTALVGCAVPSHMTIHPKGMRDEYWMPNSKRKNIGIWKWRLNMKGLFRDLFDFNSDGELDRFERTAECVFLGELFSDDDENEDDI
jgi:hypothetical protein